MNTEKKLLIIQGLQFLKLGGSLITEKDRPHTPRLDVLARLAEEIAAVKQNAPGMRLLLGHGSGSFGHIPASRYGTRSGVKTAAEWQGFVEVWREASALNRLVVDALGQAGLKTVSFPPSAAILAQDGKVAVWNLQPICAALEADLVPVIYGDVVFDEVRGGTILSTEDLFDYLARCLQPTRVLLAGLEEGVWSDFPDCTQLIDVITPANFSIYSAAIGASASTDVTGGMQSKVLQCLELVKAVPGLEMRIFSGLITGIIQHVLQGKSVGTLICQSENLTHLQ